MSAFTEANRKAFDEMSATYNSKQWQIDLSNQVATALQARKDWLGAQWTTPDSDTDIRLLDYACGTGSITKALGPHVSTIRGIDLSENMVQKYNETALTSGLSREQAHAVVGDLCGEAIPPTLLGPEWYNFDIAVIGLGFHHFENPALAAKRLGERLRPGSGVLVIVDFLPFDHRKDQGSKEGAGNFPDMQHTIKHNGFTPEHLRDLYTAAGFEDFDIVALKQPAVMELKSGTVQRTMFVAKGRKVATAWQKLSTWLGGMQDWAAGGVKVDRRDEHEWEPGFSTGGAVWNIGKQKDEDYDAFKQQAKPKAWSGF
ncbi:Hypothetical predicted protein [Lecanosticta acicola]|uniref:S-adenosyl-L-methionine-dependent methyltransferase n=1 Tax=Lecanosticta acicola TaxID=111012 RepID=A0AAI9EA81_9PEZI|nr:Hypothetical predicted protein [Lecanosticta acicola]